jgi:hypothetical protein
MVAQMFAIYIEILSGKGKSLHQSVLSPRPTGKLKVGSKLQ